MCSSHILSIYVAITNYYNADDTVIEHYSSYAVIIRYLFCVGCDHVVWYYDWYLWCWS